MFWYYVVLAFTLPGTIFSAERNERFLRRIQIAYFPFVIVLLVLFTGLRATSPDYDVYASWFSSISETLSTPEMWAAKDPAFALLCVVAATLNFGIVGVMLMLAAAAIVAQFYFCTIVSDRKWIGLFFFAVVCRTFAGSDFASIRSAVAVPLMSAAILFAFRRRTGAAWLLYLAALAFHLSVLFGLLPFLLALGKVQFRSRWWVVSLLAFTGFAMTVLQRALPLLFLIGRLAPYVDDASPSKPPPFAYFIYIAARLLCLGVIVVWFWKRSTAEERLVYFCYAMGISLQMLFIFNNALSWRSSDMFCLFDICVLMMPLRYLNRRDLRAVYAVGVVVLGSAFVCNALGILEPYKWVLA